MKRIMRIGLIVAVVSILAQAAYAQVTVSVGYADNLRPSGFFPSPWYGSLVVPAANFFGYPATASPPAGAWDSGAILIQNTSSSSVTLDGASVSGFADGSSYALWNSFIGSGFPIAPGQGVILAQTAEYNFDTSDTSPSNTPGNPATNEPVVQLNIGGTPTSFTDTAQVLNTHGYDVFTYGYPPGGDNNESFSWRLIGTSGTRSGAVPEPGTLSLLAGMGLSGAGLLFRRRRLA